MSDVFISHSSKDKETADKVVEFLEEKGLTCWIAPRDIVPGSDWAASISTAITTTKVCLVIYSKNSAESDQVAREISIAETKKDVFVIPYKIDDAELTGSFEYYLSGAHWITADYSKNDYKFEELYTIIAGVTGKAVQNITNNTYIDHLHIHSDNAAADAESVGKAVNAAVATINNNGAGQTNTAEQAKKPIEKKTLIIIIAAAVVVVAVVAAVLIMNMLNGSNSNSGAGDDVNSSSSVESSSDNSSDSATDSSSSDSSDTDNSSSSSDNNSSSSSDTNSSEPEYVTKQYSDGVYVGMMVNGKRNGMGKMTYTDGSTYEGEWKDDNINGKGILTKKSSNDTYIYESENFINGKMNGESTRTINFDSGEKWVVTGTAKDDVITSEGTSEYTWSDGSHSLYIGGLIDYAANGQGRQTIYNTDGSYEVKLGEWKDRVLYNGYNPHFDKENKMQSLTKYTNGEESKVTLYQCTYPNGDIFLGGDLVNEHREGYGTMHYKSGEVYAGEWKDDNRNGYGVMTFADGQVYEGYWDNNKINGQGTNTIYNDDGSYTINTGEWKDNKLYTGTSTVYNKDNSVRSTTKYVNGVKS